MFVCGICFIEQIYEYFCIHIILGWFVFSETNFIFVKYKFLYKDIETQTQHVGGKGF
jgi:hypothetical protein